MSRRREMVKLKRRQKKKRRVSTMRTLFWTIRKGMIYLTLARINSLHTGKVEFSLVLRA